MWERFGPLGREDEPDGLVVGGAHVAVGTMSHVLHQPLHVHHGQVVDMESSP